VSQGHWFVQCSSGHYSVLVGVTGPNLDPTGDYAARTSTDGWFIFNSGVSLWGDGKQYDNGTGDIAVGDRVGVLLDLNEGSLRFLKSSVQHGPGHPACSPTGPVVCAVQLYDPDTSVRLLPQDAAHTLLQ
jgi:hypothetical protein